MEQVLIPLVSIAVGTVLGAWITTVYSGKKRFREIVGEREVEACQAAFTRTLSLRKKWNNLPTEVTAAEYTDDDYKWILENRAFLPSDLFDIFGTINKHMCTFLRYGSEPEELKKAGNQVSKLLEQADKSLCKLFKKKPFRFV